MADKPPPPPLNTQEITIKSIITSIDKLGNDIADASDATTTGGQGRDTSTFDQKESSDDASKIKTDRSSQGSVRGGNSSHGEYTLSLMWKLNINLEQMKVALEKLEKYERELLEKIKRANQTSTEVMRKLRDAQRYGASFYSSSGAQEDDAKVLQDLVKEFWKLRHQIPILHNSSFKDSGAHDRDSESSIDGILTNMEIYNRPTMQMSKSFEQSYVFTEIKQIYEGLENPEKDCLLCFAVFPENEELKKRTLTYWWEGEGLLPQPKDGGTIEKVARGLLEDFVNKGLIEPIKKKRGKKTRSYRMNPIVHGVVVKIAEDENFFVYADKGNPTSIFQKKDKKICKKVCLLKAEKVTATRQQQEKNGNKDTKWGRPNFTVEMKVETIFNFNEPFPDLSMESFAKKKADVAEWLSKMEKLKVLHLGRWQASVKHHIEVEKTDFLKGLKNLRNLRLFSLQGVSRIYELTRSVMGLTNLKILDLKACHNLEVLPKEISYLKNLTHLDVSDCYLIDYMPKGLSDLTNLQVIKGFVVEDEQSQSTRKYCSLDGLEGMQKLRKLSLKISKRDFPSTKELTALGKLKDLKTLTMSWGADLNREENSQVSSENTPESEKDEFVKDKRLKGSQLPSGLKKLDLLYFPEVRSPSWLEPQKLTNLLKLCIREGHFGELKTNHKKWESVQTLRLKFLSEVKMSWQELQVEFPNLVCLEKVGCPRITFCPCDENGVWVKPNQEVE